ncbi:hypothetical protein M413DRAFT_443706 [Hebeloma cylindrosporum]|uniref:Peptidase A1 domain-containing protein n=1 Tax=Hebeloma cylindrosporum TaxID=76867 RepID=A0A0C3CI50_HEBCY|nr:hypothetical protein M413DRAFT_443706 [Hebeloma cylindrosporum h7]
MFRSLLLCIGFSAVLQVLALPSQELDLDEIARRYTKRTPGGLHLPIVPRAARTLKRRGVSAAIGLGDFLDVAYTVLMKIGGITTPLVLDTGSSDLWVMSDACRQGCSGVPVYPQSTFRSSGVDVQMLYGDSSTGTYAAGMIGEDAVDLAGMTQQNHYFAAINSTNTSVIEIGAAGIFGLGFPINSVVWNNLFFQNISSPNQRREEANLEHKNIKMGSAFPNLHHFRRAKFPSLPRLFGEPSKHRARQTQTKTSALLYSVFESYATLAPFLPRLVATSALSLPMFSVSLQRDSIDIGGNPGMLSIGMYSYDEGGMPAPPDSPKEIYPITWEIMLDGVYLDGAKLPPSSLSSSTIELSALVDTGNSLLRGPSDVVELIYSRLGTDGIFPCSEPHSLAFEIGGKMFPVDPRDFASQAFPDNVQRCNANLVSTDAPRVGGYQFGWSLGVPFLKSVLSSYYFGNMSYPSHDLPKMGFLSTVPSAVIAASNADKNFPAISQAAPSGTGSAALTGATPTGSRTNVNSSRRGGELQISSLWGGFITLLLVAWSIPNFVHV